MLQNKIPFCEWRLHNGSTWYWYSSSLELNLTLLPEAPYVQPPFHIPKYTSGLSLSTRSSSLSFVRSLSLSHSVSFQLSLPYHYSSAGKSCIVDTLQINAKFSNLLLKLNDNRVYSIEQQFSEMFEWIKVTCSIHISVVWLKFLDHYIGTALGAALKHSFTYIYLASSFVYFIDLAVCIFPTGSIDIQYRPFHSIAFRVQCTMYILCVYHFTIWFRNHRKKLTVEHKR